MNSARRAANSRLVSGVRIRHTWTVRVRWKIGLALLVLALLAGGAWLLMRAPDTGPLVEGKPLSHWLRLYQKGDPATHAKADGIVRAASTNAIPVLLRMLRERDSTARLKLVELARLQHLVRVRPLMAADRNQEGAIGFAILGADARDAVPALIDIYNAQISPISGFWTATSMASIGPSASNAVPALARGLNNTNMDLRLGTITALAQINSQPELSVPALVQALEDQNYMVRYYAVLALGRFGAQAAKAVPALEALKKDPDRTVKQAAIDALEKIRKQP